MIIDKEQIRELTPGQQETLAVIELQQMGKREQLLKQAGHYRGMSWLPFVVFFYRLDCHDSHEPKV